MTTYTGGTGDDSFVGGIDPDQAKGGGGDDFLFGLGGGDQLDGEDGNDTLDGGEGDDFLVGGAGQDSLSGGNGTDRLFSHLESNAFAQYPMPTLSRDTVAEADTLLGGGGDDYIYAGYGDTVDGGANGYSGDHLYISFLGAQAGVNADFRAFGTDPEATLTIGGGTISHIEYVEYLEGSNFDDTLAAIGSYYSSGGQIYGRGGNDHIITGYYTNAAYGGDGNDTIDAQQGSYLAVYGEAGDDVINGGSTVDGGTGNDTINTVGGGITHGGEGDDIITSTSTYYASQLYGDAGNDTIYGSAYYDQIEGGDGNDTIYGAWPLLDDGSGTQSSGDGDNLKGGAGSDTIYGDLGNDTIDGGSDDDFLYGGGNSDTVTGGSGNDLADGGTGDDTLYGGDGDDLLKSGAGVDQLSGEAGNDRLYFGASFGSGDLAAGGDGADQLILQGDYAPGVSLTASGLLQIETLRLLSAADASLGGAVVGSSFSYKLTLADSAISNGNSLTIDAAGLAAGEKLTVDAAAETNGRLTVTAGAGNDDVTGGAGNDTFFLQKGGSDRAIGGGGDDGFFFGAALTVADVVDGGTGTDTVALQGNYAAGLTLTGIANVEFLSLLSGANGQFGEPGTNRYAYNVTTADATVAAGATFTVQATGLLATEALTFNGSAETDGNFRVFAGQGNDVLTGGGGSDGFFFGADGNLTAADRIDGGAGTDSIALRGNYSGGGALTLADPTFANVEVLAFLSGHTNEYGGAIVAAGYDYDVTLADGNVAAGRLLDVNGAGLRADESLRFDGRAETNGSFRILSGAGDDALFGGAGNDTLYGGLGKDALEGGAGADTYQYRSAAESTSTGYDVITGFDWHVDRIDAPGTATRSFGQSGQGSLSTASFDADLAAGLSGVLGANQAALFTANGGTLSGHVFAVIDVNGTAGYQAGADLVIELAAPVLPIDPTAGLIV
jgi:Ca2+-binding RTX toxin-like protein